MPYFVPSLIVVVALSVGWFQLPPDSMVHNAIFNPFINFFHLASVNANSHECVNSPHHLTFEIQTHHKVLITGGAGFIGSHLAGYLGKVPHLKVVATDDLSGGFLENVPSGISFVQGNLQDDAFVKHLFQVHGPFDVVYHLASYAAEGLSPFIRKFNYRNNLVASVSLLNEAVLHGTKTFLFTSSAAVYGGLSYPNETQAHPGDPYAISKYAFELDLTAASSLWGINHVIFRPHNVYGIRQNILDPYRNVIGIFMRHALKGLPLPIFGDGLQSREFTYIDDIIPTIALAPFIERALNQTFNIGNKEAHTIKEVAKIVAEELGVPLNLHYLPERQEVKNVRVNHDHLKCRLGFHENKISLREGIRRMVPWAKQKYALNHPVVTKNIEVPLRLPKYWLNIEANEQFPASTHRKIIDNEGMKYYMTHEDYEKKFNQQLESVEIFPTDYPPSIREITSVYEDKFPASSHRKIINNEGMAYYMTHEAYNKAFKSSPSVDSSSDVVNKISEKTHRKIFTHDNNDYFIRHEEYHKTFAKK